MRLDAFAHRKPYPYAVVWIRNQLVNNSHLQYCVLFFLLVLDWYIYYTHSQKYNRYVWCPVEVASNKPVPGCMLELVVGFSIIVNTVLIGFMITLYLMYNCKRSPCFGCLIIRPVINTTYLNTCLRCFQHYCSDCMQDGTHNKFCVSLTTSSSSTTPGAEKSKKKEWNLFITVVPAHGH